VYLIDKYEGENRERDGQETEETSGLFIVMLGGAAELLVVGEASIGASNDLERATDLARRMVTEFGMTEALGPVRYQAEVGTGYLGYQGSLHQDLSPETAALIDQETRRLVEEEQERAMSLVTEHRATLDEVARGLQESEVIGGDEIRRIAQSSHGEKQAQVKES
jgi:cell division protease FtsH